MCKYTAYILNGWTHCTKFNVRNLIRRIVSNFVQYYNSDSIKFHTVLNFVPYYNSNTHRCPKFNPVRNLVWAKYNLVRNSIWTKNNPVRNLIHLRYRKGTKYLFEIKRLVNDASFFNSVQSVLSDLLNTFICPLLVKRTVGQPRSS